MREAKTDDPSLVGIHVFERAGLGRAPFRCVGVSQNLYPLGDGTSKPGGTCAYCGTGIEWECWIHSADGLTFPVGTDCVERTGDEGLIKAYKTSADYRAAQAAKREIRDQKVTRELADLLDDPHVQYILHALPHPNPARTDESLLDHAEWMRKNAGASGRKRILKAIRAAVASCEESSTLSELITLGEERRERIRLERARQAAVEEARKQMQAHNRNLRVRLLTELANLLHDGRGQFRDSIADSMRTHGEIPQGRGMKITLDIIGREFGRYNSEAYWNAIELAEDVFQNVSVLIDEFNKI